MRSRCKFPGHTRKATDALVGEFGEETRGQVQTTTVAALTGVDDLGRLGDAVPSDRDCRVAKGIIIGISAERRGHHAVRKCDDRVVWSVCLAARSQTWSVVCEVTTSTTA